MDQRTFSKFHKLRRLLQRNAVRRTKSFTRAIKLEVIFEYINFVWICKKLQGLVRAHSDFRKMQEKFVNAALFLRLRLPSTLIRHENGAFRKRSWNRRNLKTLALRFSWDVKRFGNGGSQQSCDFPAKVFRKHKSKLNADCRVFKLFWLSKRWQIRVWKFPGKISGKVLGAFISMKDFGLNFRKFSDWFTPEKIVPDSSWIRKDLVTDWFCRWHTSGRIRNKNFSVSGDFESGF